MGYSINRKIACSGLITASCLMASCASEQLDPLDERENYVANETVESSLSATFCTQAADAVKSKLKFIFLVDKSGSNQSTPTELGTDTDGSRRYNSILSFVQNAPTDSTVSYSLINFSTTASLAENKEFEQKSNFLTRVKNEKFKNGCPQNDLSTSPGCPVDSGWTNYQLALDRAAKLIADDTKAAALNTTEIVASYYVVFMLTDGAPIIGGVAPDYTYVSDSTIFDSVAGIIGHQFGDRKEYVEAVQLHTLFYYNDVIDNSAILRLNQMAERGKGNFVSVSAGEVIDFTKFSIPTRKIKHSLREVYVENTNSVWWNGSLLKDSDNDLLPDDIEVTLGSSSSDSDSDGNSITDGVEYMTSPDNKPCRDLSCSTSGAEPYTACADLIQGSLPHGQKYGDLDKDGLNDCEERQLLGSNYKDWDTNKDWIPDRLAVKSGIALLGSSDAYADPDADKVSNYLEMKFGTPLYFDNTRVLNRDGTVYKPMSYNLKLLSDDAIKTCYKLYIPEIHPVTSSDEFKIHILENTPIIDNKRFMRTASKPVENISLEFVQGDFQ